MRSSNAPRFVAVVPGGAPGTRATMEFLAQATRQRT